jgi:acetoin utilization deacetylase AcuC-like enzyme
MILHDTDHRLGLIEFGILIPVHDSRASKTFQKLLADPELGPAASRWHLSRIPRSIDRRDLLRVHSETYVHRLFSDALESEIIRTYELIDETGNYHRYDPQRASLPMTALFARILNRVAGTFHCCEIAVREGFCFYFGGGMHHAHRDFGHGFCPLNDIVIAARKMQAEKNISSIWIIDVDAHKGDGTAALTVDDPSIVTLSIHMAEGWPLDQPPMDAAGSPHPSFIPSDIDIPIEKKENRQYVKRLDEGLQQLDRYPAPGLAIVVSGSDPYDKDELPSAFDLKLSLDQLMSRDQLVYRFLQRRKIPAAYLMSGGYGPHSWRVYTQFLKWALRDRLHPDEDSLKGERHVVPKP